LDGLAAARGPALPFVSSRHGASGIILPLSRSALVSAFALAGVAEVVPKATKQRTLAAAFAVAPRARLPRRIE